MDADVVFHTLDIQNVVEPDLLHFVVGPHEQVTGGRNRLGRGRSGTGRSGLEPAAGLAGRPEELGVADRLEQVVQRIGAEPFERVLFEGGRENYARPLAERAGQFKAVHLRHLDVEEKQVCRVLLPHGKRFDGARTDAFEREKRRLPHVIAQQLRCQRLVVDYHRADSVHRSIMSCATKLPFRFSVRRIWRFG